MTWKFDSVFRHGLLEFTEGMLREDNPYDEKLSGDYHRRWLAGWCRGFDLAASAVIREHLKSCPVQQAWLFLHGQSLELRGVHASESVAVCRSEFSSEEAAQRYGNHMLWQHSAPLIPRTLARLLARCRSKRALRLLRECSVCICPTHRRITCPRHSDCAPWPL